MRAASKDAKDNVDNGTVNSPGSSSRSVVKRVPAGLITLLIVYGLALGRFNRPSGLPAALEETAMAHAAEYFVNHLDSDGRFEYLVRMGSPESTSPANSTDQTPPRGRRGKPITTSCVMRVRFTL